MSLKNIHTEILISELRNRLKAGAYEDHQEAFNNLQWDVSQEQFSLQADALHQLWLQEGKSNGH